MDRTLYFIIMTWLFFKCVNYYESIDSGKKFMDYDNGKYYQCKEVK